MQPLPPLPTAASIAQRNFPVLPLPSKYAALFGTKLPRLGQWKILLYGEPGSGKSSLALKFANELAKTTGKYVLYNANEEPLESNSVNIRLKSLGIHDPRIHILDARNFDTLKSYLATGKYAYCFVDSLNNFDDVSDKEVLELTTSFPNTSFVFLSKVDNDNKPEVEKNFQHLVFAIYVTKLNIKTGEHTVFLKKSRYAPTSRQADIFAL